MAKNDIQGDLDDIASEVADDLLEKFGKKLTHSDINTAVVKRLHSVHHAFSVEMVGRAGEIEYLVSSKLAKKGIVAVAPKKPMPGKATSKRGR